MKKRAFLFPGQGSQKVGMCRDLYEQYPAFRREIERADKVLDFSVSGLIYEGPEDQLDLTPYTQPCLLAVSLGVLRVLEEKGITADAVCGLSLGEYTALVAADVIEPETALRLVRKRGIFMEEAVPGGRGGMAAVIGCGRGTVERICREISAALPDGDVVEPANYNCPGQIVISGEKKAVEEAGRRLEKEGARRVVPLTSSGPFHSSMLAGAGKRLKDEFAGIRWKAPQIDYYTNVGGVRVSDPETIPEILVRQVQSGVYFEDLLRRMIEDGVEEFVEVGPGRTLSGFVKKVRREAAAYSIEDARSLTAYLRETGREAYYGRQS